MTTWMKIRALPSARLRPLPTRRCEATVAAAGGEFEPDSWLFTSENVGTGKVYGVELDLSTPLTVLGLPNTGVFLNYSWTKSEVRDFLGERRFNDQAKSVYNIGFIHDLPSLGRVLRRDLPQAG